MSIIDIFKKIIQKRPSEDNYGENLSIPSLKKFLTYLPPNPRVLNVGCGVGQDSKFLKENGCYVLGVDSSKEMITRAKEYAPDVKFELQDFMKLEPSLKYDAIWCSRVFHHMPNIGPEKFFGQAKNLLKEKGILYLTSVASDTERGEIIKNTLVIRGLTENSFKSMVMENGFEILDFIYSDDRKGMEIFARVK
jgi:SAM-dependent methyltransferase